MLPSALLPEIGTEIPPKKAIALPIEPATGNITRKRDDAISMVVLRRQSHRLRGSPETYGIILCSCSKELLLLQFAVTLVKDRQKEPRKRREQSEFGQNLGKRIQDLFFLSHFGSPEGAYQFFSRFRACCCSGSLAQATTTLLLFVLPISRKPLIECPGRPQFRETPRPRRKRAPCY